MLILTKTYKLHDSEHIKNLVYLASDKPRHVGTADTIEYLSQTSGVPKIYTTARITNCTYLVFRYRICTAHSFRRVLVPYLSAHEIRYHSSPPLRHVKPFEGILATEGFPLNPKIATSDRIA
jgi:hypothetical protein